jgi:outer membrane immunogenic protein
VYNWSGFYVGAHLGAGWARKQWSDPEAFCELTACFPSDLGSHNAIGLLGGLQAGYNWQVGYLVLGIEAQYSFASLKGDHGNSFNFFLLTGEGFITHEQDERYSTKIKGIGTIAGRLGVVSWPNDRTLFYLKGGAAFVTEELARSSSSQTLLFFCDIGCVVGEGIARTSTLSAKHSRWGWMTGIGLEYGLLDNWSAKVEYNYLHFGNRTVRLEGTECVTEPPPTGTICGPTFRDLDLRQEIHLIKFGINYRFGGGTVMAKY